MLGIITFSCHFYCMVSYLATNSSHLRGIWHRQKQALWIFLPKRKILKTNDEYQRLYPECADSVSTAICIFVLNDLVSRIQNYYRKFIIYRNIEMCDCTESEQQFYHDFCQSNSTYVVLGFKTPPTCCTTVTYFMPQICTSLSSEFINLSVSFGYEDKSNRNSTKGNLVEN